LTEMEGAKQLLKFQKQLLRKDLVIIDELGYIPFVDATLILGQMLE